MHRIRVGSLDCAVLDDGKMLDLIPEVMFPPSRRDQWPKVQWNERGNWDLPTNCIVTQSGGKTVLIDTGNGTGPALRWKGGGELLVDLAAAGVQPEDVDIVVLTHLHKDHTGGAATLTDSGWIPTFPRAKYFAPQADWDYFHTPAGAKPWSWIEDSFMSLVEHKQVELLEGTPSITPEIQLIAAPGHTPGQWAVLFQSEGQSALYLSDVVHHYTQFESPNLVRDDDCPPEECPATRIHMAKLAVEMSSLVILAHEPHPGLGRITRHGDKYIFKAME